MSAGGELFLANRWTLEAEGCLIYKVPEAPWPQQTDEAAAVMKDGG